MTLQRRDPFRDFRYIDNVRNRFWRSYDPRSHASRARSWAIPLDVVQNDDNVVITASLPGLRTEEIHVTIEDGALSIAAEKATETEESSNGYLLRERRAGKFHRAIRLPDTVDADSAESTYNDGVLTISLAKVEDEKAKKL